VSEEQAHYWSLVADKYDRVVDLQIGGAARSLVLERVAAEPQLGRAVEFGCGTGFYTATLAPKADSLLATDLAPGMVEVARARVTDPGVSFQVEDCQSTSLPDGAFDTAFVSLVLHFTEPARALAEMHRILRPGGTLIIVNLGMRAVSGAARLRTVARVLFHGIFGYRVRPPKDFGRNVLTEPELRTLLQQSGFRVLKSETLRDPSRSSNIPLDYVHAAKA